MKKGLIVFLLISMALSLSITGCRTEGESIAVAAENFIELLSQGQYEEAAEYFDDALKKELPPTALKGAWKTLRQQRGDFIGQQYQEVVDFDFHRVILITGLFEGAKVEFRVTFNDAEEIAGLYIK